MKLHKKTTFIIISILVFASVIFAGLKLYLKIKEIKSPAVEAIPSNAAFFIVFNNISSVWAKLSHENQFWLDISNIPDIKALNNEINTLINGLAENKRLNNLMSNKKFVLSCHYSGNNNYEPLFIIELESNSQEKAVNQFIKKIYINKAFTGKETFRGHPIHKISFSGTSVTFYYAVVRSLFIGSFDLSLVESAVSQLNSEGSYTDNPEFIALQNTVGKKVDANIYIHYTFFDKYLSNFLAAPHNENIDFVGGLASMTALDLFLKKDELLLNGFTACSDDARQYMRIFKNMKPRKVELTRILPSNTTFFIFQGADNIFQYYENYRAFLKANDQLKSYEKRINKINDAYGIKLSSLFCSAFDGEFALAVAGSGGGEVQGSKYAVFHLEPENGAKAINELYEKTKSNQGSNNAIISYKDFDILKIEIPGIIPAVWGKLFSDIMETYYTVIENYCIFSNSTADMVDFINSYVNGKTLQRSNSYIRFSDNVSENANIYFYFSYKYGRDLPVKYLNAGKVENYESLRESLTNFEALAIQLSSSTPFFYTNIYLSYSSEHPVEKSLVKEVILDTLMIGKPFLIKDHKSNSLKILAFDAANNIYLVDENGNIIWKTSIAERIISEVFLIDYFRNNKYQYLFNTRNYLYLIDLNGNKVADYPVKLSSAADNGITVVDYDGSGNYRILLSGDDKKIYNYTKEGKAVDGWTNPQMKASVKKSIQYIPAGNKDYFVVTDSAGNAYFLNRRGEERIRIQKKLNISSGSKFYIDQEAKNFITTDTEGNIISISADGRISEKKTGEFSKDHIFIHDDFNGDKIKDYIFLDRNKLKVLNTEGQTLMQFEFKTEIAPDLSVFRYGKEKPIILGTYSLSSGEVFLFSMEGLMEQDQIIKSRMPFEITSFLNNDKYYLISGFANILYIHPFE